MMRYLHAYIILSTAIHCDLVMHNGEVWYGHIQNYWRELVE